MEDQSFINDCLFAQTPAAPVQAETAGSYANVVADYQAGFSKTGKSLFAHIPRATQKWANRNVCVLIEGGHVKRPDRCEFCHKRSRYIDCHHTDYSKPYHVVWACRSCHRTAHYSIEQHRIACALAKDIRPPAKASHWPKSFSGPVRKSRTPAFPFGSTAMIDLETLTAPSPRVRRAWASNSR
jgi:hypothetical protein